MSKYKNSNCKTQRILHSSILKYGFEKHIFEVVCECEISELNDKERYYKDLFQAIGDKGMNCMLTKSSDKSGKLSEATIKKLTGRKMSEQAKAKMSNKKLSREHKNALLKAVTGKECSDETRAKISKGNKGKVRSVEHIEALKKRIVSEEAKQRLRTLRTGTKTSDETKIKLRAINKDRKPSDKCLANAIKATSKKVIDTSTGIIYNSATELCNLLGIKRTTLTAKLSGQNKNTTNYMYY